MRLLLAGLGSMLDRAPLGNTGRTAVGITTRMPTPEDLARILAAGREEASRSPSRRQ
ncbi:DUF3703 domain-containing protein [Nocardia sp. NPDC004278]